MIGLCGINFGELVLVGLGGVLFLEVLEGLKFFRFFICFIVFVCFVLIWYCVLI